MRTYLVLSTVHSAKGMEWDTVYLLNVVDGSFPNEFATGKPELIEEERRLLYVGLTRARNELLLCAPLKFHLTSATSPQRPARLRRPQPLPDRQGPQNPGIRRLHSPRATGETLLTEDTGDGPRRKRPPEGDVVPSNLRCRARQPGSHTAPD